MAAIIVAIDIALDVTAVGTSALDMTVAVGIRLRRDGRRQDEGSRDTGKGEKFLHDPSPSYFGPEVDP
jgi:hypothetical protein